MERFLLLVFVTLTYCNLSHTFILPLKKTNGSLDVEHLVGHMTLLEQTITGFQQTIRAQDADIASLKSEISNLKANQQLMASHSIDIGILKNQISNLKANKPIIISHNADIATIKTEISSLKVNQQRLDQRVSYLEKQSQLGQIAVDVASLKGEINAAKTEFSLASNQVISLNSKFTNLTQDYQSLSSQVQNEVNATKTQAAKVSNAVMSLTSKITNLTQDYESLSTKVQYGQNITTTVHDIQNTLGRVLSREHSAESDRFVLHGHVNRLNRTVSELSINSNVSATALSAQIAQLQTEVGFEVWMGTSDVQLKASIHSTLKFSNIQYNIGQGYNARTGVFTAPVSGKYLFWTQVRKLSGSYQEMLLEKDNSDIGYFYTHTAGPVTGTIIATSSVTAGEQVYVTIDGADTVQCCVYSTFGSSLLYMN